MQDAETAELPDWAPLVLAHAEEPLQTAFQNLLRLDARLSRLVASVSEPALGQIRLAWWREEIGRSAAAGARQPPDPLLAAIAETWSTEARALGKLVDGWECTLDERPLPPHAAQSFVEGRAACFSALARLAGQEGAENAAATHGARWAMNDLLMEGTGPTAKLVALPSLPRKLRSLAIVGGLADRAIGKGGQPLIGDRFSPLVALRLGIFGT